MHKNIFALMRTRTSLETLDESQETYTKHQVPHNMAKFGVAFETPALNLPARTSDAGEVWKFYLIIDNESHIEVSYKIPEKPSYRDMKEAIHYSRQAMGNLVDKRIAEHHTEHLQTVTSFD